MKRHALVAHLRKHGCTLVREGAKHSWFANAKTGVYSAVPRHREIVDFLVRKICRELRIPLP
ncbi:MAG: addiction module toxin, HicA family [Deltaproteobacteria bacterium]|nr:MAG: addiction module toxin, HicA family [Deltaproteobacteria bacterium]TMA59023.1 MAG: addiction module toxin, HicA family [Deltaproteobacteria bacterium]